MSERLYQQDAYLTQFRARVIERRAGGREVVLDRTAFYPTSGGQPHDTGTLDGVPVVDVVEDDDRIVHRLEQPLAATEVTGRIDWDRRFDHMQQHTGQHLLTAVFERLAGARTVGFHLGAGNSTLDLDTAPLPPEQLRQVELRANELITENRPVKVDYQEAAAAAGVRNRAHREGLLRIVTIEGLDRSACGGTHVRATGEIGCLLLRGQEKVHGGTRIEFLGGRRAVRRAREDFELLSRTARVFSSRLEEVPSLVAATREKLAAAEKARQRTARELAGLKGSELYRETRPNARGRRLVVRRMAQGPFPAELRVEAQSFTEHPQAVFLAAAEEPAMVLVAVAADTGLDAGELLRAALAGAGGRGGGNRRLAQGRLPSREALERVLADLEAEI